MHEDVKNEEYDAIFTAEIIRLFTILSAWTELSQRADRHTLDLWLGVCYPDHHGTDMETWPGGGQGYERGQDSEVYEYIHSRPNFLEIGFDSRVSLRREISPLPTVPFIQLLVPRTIPSAARYEYKVEASDTHRRRIWLSPSVLPKLARALPNLTDLCWKHHPLERRFDELRRQQDTNLAEALIACVQHGVWRNLTGLSLSLKEHDPHSHEFRLRWPASCDPRVTCWPTGSLEALMRQISQLPALRTLVLHDWPASSEQLWEADWPSGWPLLQSFVLHTGFLTVDGRCMVASPDRQREGQVCLRDIYSGTTPVDSVVVPVIEAMVRATARMRKLRSLIWQAGNTSKYEATI
ncbi:hypothetical protein V8F06_011526 [Rhypophila decipiens]